MNCRDFPALLTGCEIGQAARLYPIPIGFPIICPGFDEEYIEGESYEEGHYAGIQQRTKGGF